MSGHDNTEQAEQDNKTVTKDDQSLEISLVNDVRELARVASEIDKFCAQHKLGDHTGYAVNLSVEEILTNTISYGYDDEQAHRIEIIVFSDDESVMVVIVDDSTAFDLSQTPHTDTESSLDERALGGLGLFLVHQMMDNVQHRYVEGCNVVTLTKNTGRKHTQSD